MKKKIINCLLLILVGIMFLVFAVGSGSDSNTNSTKYDLSEASKSESKEEYINSCASYSFKEISRNPNNYVGKRAVFAGKVIQVSTDGNKVQLRVNVTVDSYGYYDDTILVNYTYKDANESKILEDDIITIYGELQGDTSYTSVLGSKITLPLMIANYIDIQQ